MKIAITSTDNNLDAKPDSHFGRCAYFVVYDTDTKGIEFLPNPHRENFENAGLAVVQMLSLRGVGKIVTGELGLKVKPILDSLQIQMIIYKNQEKTIKEIINMLNH